LLGGGVVFCRKVNPTEGKGKGRKKRTKKYLSAFLLGKKKHEKGGGMNKMKQGRNGEESL